MIFSLFLEKKIDNNKNPTPIINKNFNIPKTSVTVAINNKGGIVVKLSILIILHHFEKTFISKQALAFFHF